MKKVFFIIAFAAFAFSLFFVSFQPTIAHGFSFDYAVGGHSVDLGSSITTWSEASPDPPNKSFTLVGDGYNFQLVHYTWYNTTAIKSASAVRGDAYYGQMGVSAKAVDTSGSVHAKVQRASAGVQMGGAFYITGPTATVDLKVRTTLDGSIGVTLQAGISNSSLISFEMTAASQNINNYFNSATGWSIYSLSGNDQGGNPVNAGLYQTGMPLNDKLSDTGSYQFTDYELILTLAGVKTNQVFNLDLFLSTDIAGPALYGTLGDEVSFFSTYSMGFSTSDQGQWFELPNGYSISAAPVPIPPSVWLLGAGLIGLVGLRRRFKK